MLFYLTDSLLVDKKASEYLEIATAISNLSIAVYESKHSINGDFSIIEFMSKNVDIDIRARNILNNVAQQFAFYSIPQHITFYIEVVRETTDQPLREEESKQIAQVCYKEFLDTKSTQESCLIGEYYYDCTFFHVILNWYKTKMGITLSTLFEDIDGSGDDTYKKVKQFVGRNKRPTLCIVDSDKKYPNQIIAEDSTCGKCMKLYPHNYIYRFIALNVHEVENLVPLSVIDGLSWAGDAKFHKESFDYLRNSHENLEILPFFDIKMGIKYYKSLFENPDYLVYVEKCCMCHPQIPKGDQFGKFIDSLSEKDVVYPSLLKGLLKNSLEFISKNKITSFDLMDFQEKEWCTIAQNMLNWGFCRNKENVI